MTESSTFDRAAQRQAALDVANQVKRERRKLYIKLNEGKITFDDLLSEPVMQKAEIGKTLKQKKGIGNRRVRIWLSRIGIAESRHIGDLTEHQKKRLLEHLK